MQTYEEKLIQLIKRPGTPRTLVVLYGVPGSGKSTLRSKLVDMLKKDGYSSSISVLSLDDFRIQCNKGVYPRNKSEHDRCNQIAIPQFEKAVETDKNDIIIIDNTHLRWQPDWQLATKKCTKDSYDLVCVVPQMSEYALLTCRSLHLDSSMDPIIFLQLFARWGGYRFHQFFNRRVSCDVVPCILPKKADSFTANKMFVKRWGQGFLYVLDGYLGYIDRKMVQMVIKASNAMKQKVQDFPAFRKDSLYHVTLIQPGVMPVDKMKGVITNIISKYATPPEINYNGVNCIQDPTDEENRTYYLSVTQKTQDVWKTIVPKQVFNSDGLHVTLGFMKNDVWRVDKTVTPKFPFDENNLSSTFSDQYELEIQKDLTLDEWKKVTLQTKSFIKSAERFFKVEVSSALPKEVTIRLNELVSRWDIKHKWRMCPSSRFYMLSFQVIPDRNLGDEGVYKRSPILLRWVPRGLTYMFHRNESNELSLVSSIYPTAKFFGDTDKDEDVEVMSKQDVSSLEETQSREDKLYITEKVNGEMCTVNAFSYQNHHYIVCGSKNNKFLFHIDVNLDQHGFVENIMTQISKYMTVDNQQFSEDYLTDPAWMAQNVWVEITLVFMKTFSKLTKKEREHFIHLLHGKRITLCGELESYLHPHLEAFGKGHQAIVFFSASTYDDHFNVQFIEPEIQLEIFRELESMKFQTVNVRVASYTSLTSFIEKLRNVENKEGYVLWVPTKSNSLERLKVKTIWYVVHRGLRERLRRYLIPSTGKHSQTVNMKNLKPDLEKTVRAKLEIFCLDEKSEAFQTYTKYVDELEKYIYDRMRKDFSSLKNEFLFDYPKIIQLVSQKTQVPVVFEHSR